MTARFFCRRGQSLKPRTWRVGQSRGRSSTQPEGCWPWAPMLLKLPGCLLFVSSLGAQLKQRRRVLIVNDLGTVSSLAFSELDQAILSCLRISVSQIDL